MKKKGFHSGLACLFYGTPGTGKTETVYQLAKHTGRDVMLVDIPQIRSMWVGESEKMSREYSTTIGIMCEKIVESLYCFSSRQTPL